MKQSLRSRILLLLVGACLVAPPVVATDGDEPSSVDPGVNPSVLYETATVRARPVDRATASVTILDRERIEELNVASVAELIRFANGVDVSTTGPRGGFATAQIGGGDPNFTTVLLDGVPLNDITDQVGGAVNLNSLSTAHVERIEVVRGPLSSFFGSTGLGGAINIVTRHGNTDTLGWSVDGAIGDDSALGSAAISRGTERRNFFVGLTWEQAEDQISGGQDEFRQLGVQANARVPLGKTAELELNGRVAIWDAEDYPEASGGPLLGSGETRVSENDEFNLGAEVWLGNPEHRHKIQAAAYQHRLDRTSPFILDPADPFASVPASVEDTTFTTWQLGWTAPPIEFWNSRLNLGVDGRLEDGESDSEFVGAFPILYRIDRTYGGGFAEWLVERGRAVIEVGARVDVVEGFDTELNPRIGLFYLLPGDKTRVRASAGRAYKLPSFFALSVPFFGNPDLRTETVVGVDAGLDHTFTAIGLTTKVRLFYNQFKHLVTFVDGRLDNVSEVESQGAELAIDWTATPNILVHTNVTYQDFDQPGSTSPLTHRPEWFGAASFSWRIQDRIRWVLDGQWVAKAFDFQLPLNDPPNSFGTELTSAYQLYGTALTVKVASHWGVHARVDNLSDEEYQPFIGFPGPDLSARVGLRYQSD